MMMMLMMRSDRESESEIRRRNPFSDSTSFHLLLSDCVNTYNRGNDVQKQDS
jgi:hypothetical protein